MEFKRNKAEDIVEKGSTESHREALVVLAKEMDVVKGRIEGKQLDIGESMVEVYVLGVMPKLRA